MIDKALYKNKKTKPVKQAGVVNYLGKQKMVTAPKFWLSEPGHVKAKLAYITDEEEKILIDKNLYGSLKGKPNKGPAGLPSLQGGDSGGLGGGSSSSGDNDGPTGRDKHMGLQGKTGRPDKSLDVGGRGVDRSKVSQFSQYGKNVMAQNLQSLQPSPLERAINLYRKLPTPTNIAINLAKKFGPVNNLDFFNQKVTPAGKFKGKGFDDYMSQRMAGTIDAYGNPIGRDDGKNILQTGIMEVQGVIPTETKAPLSKSASLKDLDFNYGTFSNPVMYSDL